MRATKIRRAKELHFECENALHFTLPPPTIRQIADCIALDSLLSDAPEMPSHRAERVMAQARILAGDNLAVTVDALTLNEATQLLHAVFAHVHGVNAPDLASLQKWLGAESKKKWRKPKAGELSEQLDAMTIELAVHNHCTPGQAEQMPIRDALSMLELINKRQADQIRFEAAIHGAKLR